MSSNLSPGCTLGRRFITRLRPLGAVAGSHCGRAVLSRRIGHGSANHAEHEGEMYDDDATEASIRRSLDLPE
jgi:hypothetical protein